MAEGERVLATWNVNSIRARLQRVLAWLDKHRPDVLCLQGLKVEIDAFTAGPFAELGYDTVVFGQPAYDEVAIGSRNESARVVRVSATIRTTGRHGSSSPPSTRCGSAARTRPTGDDRVGGLRAQAGVVPPVARLARAHGRSPGAAGGVWRSQRRSGRRGRQVPEALVRLACRRAWDHLALFAPIRNAEDLVVWRERIADLQQRHPHIDLLARCGCDGGRCG